MKLALAYEIKFEKSFEQKRTFDVIDYEFVSNCDFVFEIKRKEPGWKKETLRGNAVRLPGIQNYEPLTFKKSNAFWLISERNWD